MALFGLMSKAASLALLLRDGKRYCWPLMPMVEVRFLRHLPTHVDPLIYDYLHRCDLICQFRQLLKGWKGWFTIVRNLLAERWPSLPRYR